MSFQATAFRPINAAATRPFAPSFNPTGDRRWYLFGGKSRVLLLPISLHFQGSNISCSVVPEASPITYDDPENRESPVVRIVAVVGDTSVSPLKGATWNEVMLQTATKLKWVDEGFEMKVFSDKCLSSGDPNVCAMQEELAKADLLVIVAVKNQDSIKQLEQNSTLIPNIFCFESSSSLKNKLGGSFIDMEVGGSFFSSMLSIQKNGKGALDTIKTVSDAWDRYNSDDVRFCILVIINAYICPVPSLKNLRAKGFSTLSCMVRNCGAQVVNCLLDPNCRKALQCLNSCSPADQVCNYRCIASYESPQLEAFSLCILEKHNCLELDAEIPDKPYVPPLVSFRSESMSNELAEDLFIGWLGTMEWSWRVIAGQNPAYDQFPCQYQLFYRGKARGSFWYEPVFQVKTLEGKLVWRRRRYRVKRGGVPGKFVFTVLDNGVVSREMWTIVDVCDDLSWALFHYHGAAKTAGVSYTGAVLVSPDGMYPPDMGGERLAAALEKCGIKPWELHTVDNGSCFNPPLGIPDGSSLHCKIKVIK